MAKTAAIGFVTGAIFSFCLAAFVGLFSVPDFENQIAETDARSELIRVFEPEMASGLQLSVARGAFSHNWIIRRSFISGNASHGKLFSEQVLKVGWPFTISRGFVHHRGPERHGHGAVVFGSEIEPPHSRILPFQPVWPGVIFWGLAGMAISVGFKIRRKGKRAG